ncbi:MAG: P-II family nitrogen regulator [Bacilli bacterium]|nr:P-II family nitrogen regulator [Bacilli bacterium]
MDLSTVQPGFEVVMAIVNDGFTDLVMEAAKKAGARGGTILQARGTGNKEIEQFFGVRITPEKQIVMIIVPKDIRDEVLRLIYEAAGLNTKGQGIAFSFATSDVVGIQTENKEVTSGEVK